MATIFDSVTNLFGPKDGQTTSGSEVNPLNNLSPENREEIHSTVTKVIFWLISATLVLVPILVVPLMADSYELPKNALLFGAGAISFILWLANSFFTKRSAMTRSIFDLPVLAFAIATVISAVLSTNRPISLASDPLTIVGGTLLFLVISSYATKREVWERFAQALLLSGTILGIWTVLSYIVTLGAPVLKVTIPVIFLSPLFSAAGSPLAQMVYLAILLPLAIGLGMRGTRKPSLFGLISMGSIVLGLVLGAFTLYTSNPALLDLGTGWKVATGAISQSLRSALFGVSPAHYVDAFTIHHGVEFNNGPLWNSRFATSSNFYLYALTTLGIVGLATFAWIAVRLAVVLKKRIESESMTTVEKGLLGSLGVSLILFAFLPAPTVTLFGFFALLGLLVSYYHNQEIKAFAWSKDGLANGTIRAIIGAVAIVVTVGAGFYLTKFVLADYYFGQSLQSAQANRGADTYNYQIQAIVQNEWNDSYHAAYAQTNLALADSLASQPNLTDQQKQTVVQLVQQAIREGRIVASLEPARASGWENLSFIYRNLINFAEGADQWSVATQNQAIALDPLQPRLRLDLGGIYFAAGDYQTAAQIFAQAVNLKPDYANAHYNLAQALKNLKLNEQALAQLQLTGALVCSVSAEAPDCVRVNQEITELGSAPASPAAVVAPAAATGNTAPLATPSSNTTLENAKTTPPARISSPSGEISR